MGLGRKIIGGLLTYEGNSFFAAPYNVPSTINTGLTGAGDKFTSVNYGVGASGTGYNAGGTNYMLYTTRYNAVVARYDSTSYRNVLCCFEGINDLYYYTNGGFTISDCVTNGYNNYVSYYSYTSGLASLGFRCVLNTLTPRSGGTVSANYEPARQNASNKFDTSTINGLLRNDFDIEVSTRIRKSSLAKWTNCVLIDVGDDPNFGQTGQSTDTNYYVDGTHPTALMISQLSSNYYVPAIRILF